MKNTILATCFILSAWFKCEAQESKFNFGVNLFPNYSLGIVSNDGTVPSYIESVYKDNETWKPSLSVGAFVELKLNKKSLLGAGVGYQNNGERTQKISSNYPGFYSPGGRPVFEDIETRAVYSHHNVEIPLYFRYMLSSRIFLSAGTSGIINMANRISRITYYDDKPKEKTTVDDKSADYRRFNISGNIGFGFDYLKTKKMSLYAFPYVQYGFLGNAENAPLNRNFLSAGLSTGIRFNSGGDKTPR